MSNRIRTGDAQSSLRQILEEKARQAAGSNTVVSRQEGANLDPVLQRADAALRAEGGKGTRVTVDRLVDKAVQQSAAVWSEFNASSPSDATYLSKAEVEQVRQKDPALGALTELAYLRAGKRGQDGAAVVKDFFNRFDFADRRFGRESLPGGGRVDARMGQPGRAGVPAAVLQVFDHYYRAENADWASVSLHKGKAGGKEVWAVYMVTDGDDEYLDVLEPDGKPLASARLNAGTILAWDEFPGRARLSPTFTATFGDVYQKEGLSDPAERAAAGQIPVDWPGDVTVRGGAVHHKGVLPTTMELDTSKPLSDEQRAVAYAAMDLVFERVLRNRIDNDAPLKLGATEQGELRVGEFTSPVDGKAYLVADWQDIDDASYTFYFERTAFGPQLAIDQSNN